MSRTCHRCGADLTHPKSVSRLYVSKDTDQYDDAHCMGHYEKDFFEPDESVTLEHHDLLDNSDECAICGANVTEITWIETLLQKIMARKEVIPQLMGLDPELDKMIERALKK